MGRGRRPGPRCVARRDTGRAPRDAPERRERFATTSDIEIRDLYTPADTAGLDEERDLGRPGEYPFTRGVQPTMYRGRLWTMRQYAGFATRRGDQRALPVPARAGPDRPVGRVRSADSDGLRLRRAVGRRGGRPGRRPDQLDRRHGALLDGLPLGDVTHLDDDQRHGGDPARLLRRGRRRQGIARDKLGGTRPERHPQGVHRAGHVHLPARPPRCAW